MLDLQPADDESEIVPAQKDRRQRGRRLAALGEDFVTEAVDELRLGFDGIEGDLHAGYTRKSGSREPWYPRGTEMRNERQLSIVAARRAGDRRRAHGHCRGQA